MSQDCCAQCQRLLSPTDSYCPSCGTSHHAPAAATPVSPNKVETVPWLTSFGKRVSRIARFFGFGWALGQPKQEDESQPKTHWYWRYAVPLLAMVYVLNSQRQLEEARRQRLLPRPPMLGAAPPATGPAPQQTGLPSPDRGNATSAYWRTALLKLHRLERDFPRPESGESTKQYYEALGKYLSGLVREVRSVPANNADPKLTELISKQLADLEELARILALVKAKASTIVLASPAMETMERGWAALDADAFDNAPQETRLLVEQLVAVVARIDGHENDRIRLQGALSERYPSQKFHLDSP